MLGIRAMLALGVAGLAAMPAAHAQTQDDSPIVVRGSLQQPSGWREAETDHVIVTSNGSEAEVSRIAQNLERLHFLISALLNRIDKEDNTVKLRVTLIGNTIEFDAMDLRNLRSRQGPYASAFRYQRYYDPREDGAVLAVSRIDQYAFLDPGTRLDALDISQLIQAPVTPPGMEPGADAGAFDPSPYFVLNQRTSFGSLGQDPAGAVNSVTVPLPAEDRIYAGYAQHYLMTYFPGAYPRWYVDGFGELFATVKFRGDSKLEFGRAPEGYRRAVDWYRNYPIRDVFNGKYLQPKSSSRWTPFHAWQVTHYLFFSDTRRPQLRAYFAALANGEDAQKAAEVFGDLAVLDREVQRYDNGKMPYEVMAYPADRIGEPIVQRLTIGRAEFLKGRLELGSRVDIPPPPPVGADFATSRRANEARNKALADRDRWLVGLRREAARYSENAEAQLLLAEAECRSGNGAECLAAAERALKLSPESAVALAWKGNAMVQLAVAGPAAQRTARLKAARAVIAKANRIDSESPVPLLAYFRSFAAADAEAPDVALEGVLKAIDRVPAAPAPRLMLGEEFARRENPVAARQALKPVAYGPYDTPEGPKAREILAKAPPAQ
ncbi:MAG: hypothetical protein EOP62_20110 [Sphingomonadales bacterium]|nr:MAG: hypothetical protein EOP62_20110 [Sphingomonadales bacterium]